MAEGGGFLGALTGGAIGSAVVHLVLDADQYNAQLAQAKTQTAASTTQMSASVNKTSTAVGALADVAKLAAAAYGAKFLADGIAQAIEAEQVLTQLTTVVGENTVAYEEQAQALMDLTGFSDEAILSADTILARFKLTGEQVRAAIPVVLDYARAVGKDVPAAASAIGKALLGNSRALKEVGIEFTRTGQRGQDFTTVLGLLEDKVGGTAKAFGQTTAGQLAIAQQNFEEMQESIGEQLLPTLTELIPIVTDFAEIVGGVVAEALAQANELVTPLTDGLAALGDVIGELGGESATTGESIRDDLIGGALDALTPDFLKAARAVDEYRQAQSDAQWEITRFALEHIDMAEAIRYGRAAFLRFIPNVQTAAEEENNLASSVREAALAMREQREEMRLLIGGQVGLLQAQSNVDEATRNYNEAVSENGGRSREARSAALDLVDAQLELKSQLQEQRDAMRETDETLPSIIERFDRMALSLGVNRDTLAALNRELAQFNQLAAVGREFTGGFTIQGGGGRSPVGWEQDLRRVAQRTAP